MATLFHYTCADGYRGIKKSGMILMPCQHPWLPVPLVWLTDMEEPDRWALGLMSVTLQCDRTEHRLTVDSDSCIPWSLFCRENGILRATRDNFELPDGQPRHWWVSLEPIECREGA